MQDTSYSLQWLVRILPYVASQQVRKAQTCMGEVLLHAGTVHTSCYLHNDRTIPFCTHVVCITSISIKLHHGWKERDSDKEIHLTVVAIRVNNPLHTALSHTFVCYHNTYYLQRGSTSPGRQIARAAEFCTVAPNICKSSVQNVTPPFWRLQFWGGSCPSVHMYHDIHYDMNISLHKGNMSRKSSVITIRRGKRILHMKTSTYLWYLAELFLQWEMFHM